MKKQIVNLGLGTRKYVINGVRYIVFNRFERIDIKNYRGNNHLNERLEKYITGDFAELPVNNNDDKMAGEYDCSTVGRRTECSRKTKKENMGTAALYCRLSRDDGTESESNSIGNQKKLLLQKAKDLGFEQTKYYVDDGYTGTNFNRPGFQQMLSDIDMGYIKAVLVKDLSRLGRDYVSVGNYTDTYFPDRDVRFIAVNDAIDSDEGESEIAPFKNILNEMYARDISKKVSFISSPARQYGRAAVTAAVRIYEIAHR